MYKFKSIRRLLGGLLFGTLMLIVGVLATILLGYASYKAGYISWRIHPGPPVKFERQGTALTTGAITSLYPLNFEKIKLPYTDSQGRGGAMFNSDTATFHAQRDGSIYRMTDGGMVKLDIDPPFNLEASMGRSNRLIERWFMGIAAAELQEIDGNWLLVVSYMITRPKSSCLLVVLATQAFHDGYLNNPVGTGWNEVFETNSCADPSKRLIAGATSAALAIDGNRVFFAQGAIAQDLEKTREDLLAGTATPHNQASSKVFEIDLNTGKASIFASGFRNLSGMIIGEDETLWTVEHGPRGGDELNLVSKGGEYGWPMTTVGTEYTSFGWLGADQPGKHIGATPPVFSWVPSIAPSAVREVKGGQFPNWQGDLIVSSLRAGSLYRVQLNGNKPMLVEPIVIGRRIRDFVEGHDGALYLLLARDGRILKITAGRSNPNENSASALTFCASCHQLHHQDENRYSGPSLVGIVGRDIASIPDYPYSVALSKIEGRWTTETLDKFLENSEVFGENSTMPNARLGFTQRKLVIDGLVHLDRVKKHATQ